MDYGKEWMYTGLVLEPLIALCLLNTVDEHLYFCNVSKYADDDKVFASINSEKDQEEMQKDIDRVVKWAEAWGFVLNEDKCPLLQFGGKKVYDFFMNEIKVKRVDHAKDLGVVVDSKFTFHDNIKATVSKAKKSFLYVKSISS